MLQMDLPHLNILTKIDNLVNYPPLTFNLDFYTEVHDLEYLLPALDSERLGKPQPTEEELDAMEDDGEGDNLAAAPKNKFSALNRAIIDLIQDFALVGFETLAVEDKHSMASLLKAIDRASGYAFGTQDGAANDSVWRVAMRDSGVTMDVRDVQERWIDRRAEHDEIERQMWEAEGKQWREGPDAGNAEDEMEGMIGGGRGMMGRESTTSSGIKIVRKTQANNGG
jgi:hypothetical protein